MDDIHPVRSFLIGLLIVSLLALAGYFWPVQQVDGQCYNRDPVGGTCR